MITICHTKSKGTSLDHWHHVLVGLHFHDKMELKRRLITKYEEHTLLPKYGETTMEYIQRHGQHIPLSSQKKQKAGVINTEINIKSRKRQREEEREKEKWQVGENTPSVTNKVTPQHSGIQG